MAIFVDVLKFLVLILITFFTCQIITDGKKRISYIGTLLICFSSAIIEYIDSGLVEAIISGELILMAINHLLKDSRNQLLYLVAIPVRSIRFFIAF